MEQIYAILIEYLKSNFAYVLIALIVSEVLPYMPFIKANSSLQFIGDFLRGLANAIKAMLDNMQAPPPAKTSDSVKE
jgi:hypothetical protein